VRSQLAVRIRALAALPHRSWPRGAAVVLHGMRCTRIRRLKGPRFQGSVRFLVRSSALLGGRNAYTDGQ